jgi:hypothetical protein
MYLKQHFSPLLCVNVERPVPCGEKHTSQVSIFKRDVIITVVIHLLKPRVCVPPGLNVNKTQCTYNITMRRARVCVCVALVIQHAKRSTALYCHMWPLWLHHILRHYLINGAIFGRRLLKIKYVF